MSKDSLKKKASNPRRSGNPAVRAQAADVERTRKAKIARKKLFMQITVFSVVAVLAVTVMATGIISGSL